MVDMLIKWQTEQLLSRELRRTDTTVFVRPELVVEVAFAELFTSRRYESKLALG